MTEIFDVLMSVLQVLKQIALSCTIISSYPQSLRTLRTVPPLIDEPSASMPASQYPWTPAVAVVVTAFAFYPVFHWVGNGGTLFTWSPSSAVSNTQRVRALLGMGAEQGTGLQWWRPLSWLTVGGCTVLFILVVFVQRLMSTKRPEADSWKSNKRRRGDQNAVHASKMVKQEQGAHAIPCAQECDPSYRPGTSVGQLTLQSTHTEHSNRAHVEEMAGHVQAGMASETTMFIERTANDVSGSVLTFSVSSNFQKRCSWNACFVCSPHGQQTPIAWNRPVLVEGRVAPELLTSRGGIEIAFCFVVAPNSVTGARIFLRLLFELIGACQEQTFAPS